MSNIDIETELESIDPETLVSEESSNYDIIADTLGVEQKPIVRPEKTYSQVPVTQDDFEETKKDNLKADYTLVRDNIKNTLLEVEGVIDDAVSEVRSNPSARMLETFSTLIRTYADLNKDLLSIHGTSETKKESNSTQKNPTVNNIVFTGDSDSIVDIIKKHT